MNIKNYDVRKGMSESRNWKDIRNILKSGTCY